MYYFIVNPNSRTGTGAKTWKCLESLLKTRKVSYEVFFTTPEYGADKITDSLCQRGEACTIVVLGGDGSINDTVQGLSRPELVTLGYIPVGSGNDFARDYQLPMEPAEALSNILNPKHILPMDIGCVRVPDGRLRYFAGSCGMGFDAAVCVEALDSPIKRALNHLHLGKFTYVAIALKQILTFHPYPLAIKRQGKKPVHFKNTYFACAMNLPYEGGGLKLAPDAQGDDDYLNACIISSLPRFLLPVLLPTAFFGKHLIFRRYIHYHPCKSLAIKALNPLPVHTDGEIFGQFRQAVISLSGRRIRVIAGPDYHRS